ncbi:SDR family NAD(P)-dependent oxidoreductase [Acinetobacter larvae]|uniref:SDR family NAD(P)-dependent oxidoreductase n=1 Tax=Acinetobacter larvae TaxID=1789224 RepID=UPI0009D74F9F|nr:SDR family NAD(P)-dependent oxidoreductase [Acinetobacter larvae]
MILSSIENTKSSCVVITGATRGIGFGLAKAFLDLGWHVVIAGRDQAQLQKSLKQLANEYGAAHIVGQCCDVTNYDDLQNLWRYAQQQFKYIDVWINNAGSCTAAKAFQEISAVELQQVVQTNVLGAMFGAQIALKGMSVQGFGQIFNMEGWGSRGEWSAGMTAYATTKRAVGYFSHALYREAKHSQIKIGTLSPGMVATDLLISSWQHGDARHWRKMKWLFMFVIDSPEIVCAYLAQRVSRNKQNNVRIVWMSPWRLLLRFLQPYYWRRNPVQGTALDDLGK